MKLNLPPVKNGKYKQGHYHPENPQKYIGDVTKIIFRSSLEFKLCRYLDVNDKILKWGSEIVSIPYKRPFINQFNEVEYKSHTYYVDYYAEVVNKNLLSGVEKMLIEVKPHKEYLQVINNIIPAKPLKETKKKLESWNYALNEYNKNKYKWSFANQYSNERGYTFLVITEEIINKLPI
jgi:hypothetical protein